MTVTISPATKAKPVFPSAVIEACLRDELIRAGEMVAGLEGRTLPSDPAALLNEPLCLDSLVVVELLCAVEELVGFELPDRVVRAGGYDTVGEATGHLMPRIEKEWQKRNGGAT